MYFQPPVCDANGENELKRRRKRQTIEIDDSDGELYDPDREDLRVKVYSGLYVNEATDLDDDLGSSEDYDSELVSRHLQWPASDHSQGFEDKNLGSSPAVGSCSNGTPAGGTPQILIFKT